MELVHTTARVATNFKVQSAMLKRPLRLGPYDF